MHDFEHNLVYSPLRRLLAVYVERPVADPELLVEGGHLVAHVGHPAPLSVAQVEDLAVELEVGVEADRAAGAVERERRVRKLLPPFDLKVMI